MKFVKTLLAVAALGAAFTAQAESNLTSAATPNITAAARLNFSVVIPRVIYLRVGTGTDFTPNATIDTVIFTPGAAAGNSTPVAASSGTVGVRLFATGVGVSIGSVGSGTGLVSGANIIPWTQISATSSGLAHPVIGAAAAAVAPTGAITTQTAVWTFNYGNAPTAAGTYTGQVTYTATML